MAPTSLSKTVAGERFTTPLIATIASTFALGSTLIRFAYDAGADTFAVTATRASVASVGLGLILIATRVPLRIPRREFRSAVLLGALMAGYVGAMYQSFIYMPIALGVAAFYTYPLMTGLIAWIVGREKIGPRVGFALPLAFVGLILALDVSGERFNLIGASWALLGAAGFTTVLTLSSHVFKRDGNVQFRTWVMLCSASGTAVVAILVRAFIGAGVTHFPQSIPGWAGLMGSSLCYLIGVTGLMYVIPIAGAARVGLIMNVEPIASIVLTYLILGERLRPIQLVGVSLVVFAILIFQSSRTNQKLDENTA